MRRQPRRLGPIARDSRKWRGKRCIGGGRAEPRHALCTPAPVATRFNSDLKAAYQVLPAAGKPAKVALTAVMRKLLILANALLRKNAAWMPKLASTKRIP